MRDSEELAAKAVHSGLLRSELTYTLLIYQPLSKLAARAIVVRRAEQAELGILATHDLRRDTAD